MRKGKTKNQESEVSSLEWLPYKEAVEAMTYEDDKETLREARKYLKVVDKAMKFAVKKHAGGIRKGSNTPHIMHPAEAGAIAAGLTEDREVIAAAILHDTLEERKVSLIAHSDACAVLPGGMGTLDEVSEVCVRMQLGLARRPVALLNTLGYYDGLDAFRQRMAKEGFLSPEWAQIWTKKDSPEELLSWLDAQTQ